MKRRTVLAGLVAAAVAPVGAQAAAPMLVLWGDGVHDDTDAMQSLIDGRAVKMPGGLTLQRINGSSMSLPPGTYLVGGRLRI